MTETWDLQNRESFNPAKMGSFQFADFFCRKYFLSLPFFRSSPLVFSFPTTLFYHDLSWQKESGESQKKALDMLKSFLQTKRGGMSKRRAALVVQSDVVINAPSFL